MARTQVDPTTPFWLWMNLLSLDAPVVAVVWQDFVARCYPSILRPSGRWVLGLTVWSIYLADRILDVRASQARAHETARHQFCRRHETLIKALLAIALIADLLVAALWLRPAVLANGLAPGAAVGAYLTVFAFWRIAGWWWKQLAAAALFTAGVFLVGWTGTPNPMRLLGWPALGFCILCWANLMMIESWERKVRVTWFGLLVFAGLCLIPGAGTRWYLALGLAAAGLAGLEIGRGAFSEEARRVAADAVLLTPLLFQ